MRHYAPLVGPVKLMALKHALFGVPMLLGIAGCRAGPPRTASFHLVEKGPYQALYGADGHVERIVQDADGDRRAEAVLLYAPSGKLLRAEIDTDRDGRVDRWEYFDARGVLERAVTSR